MTLAVLLGLSPLLCIRVVILSDCFYLPINGSISIYGEEDGT